MITQLSLKNVTRISKNIKVASQSSGDVLYAFHSIQPLDLQITSINRWKVKWKLARWLPKKKTNFPWNMWPAFPEHKSCIHAKIKQPATPKSKLVKVSYTNPVYPFHSNQATLSSLLKDRDRCSIRSHILFGVRKLSLWNFDGISTLNHPLRARCWLMLFSWVTLTPGFST